LPITIPQSEFKKQEINKPWSPEWFFIRRYLINQYFNKMLGEDIDWVTGYSPARQNQSLKKK
jgi:hypothetical protein